MNILDLIMVLKRHNPSFVYNKDLDFEENIIECYVETFSWFRRKFFRRGIERKVARLQIALEYWCLGDEYVIYKNFENDYKEEAKEYYYDFLQNVKYVNNKRGLYGIFKEEFIWDLYILYVDNGYVVEEVRKRYSELGW